MYLFSIYNKFTFNSFLTLLLPVTFIDMLIVFINGLN